MIYDIDTKYPCIVYTRNKNNTQYIHEKILHYKIVG